MTTIIIPTTPPIMAYGVLFDFLCIGVYGK
jgi:hypothetical protein